jgi:polyphosphate kinase 2 (PPK2 family)
VRVHTLVPKSVWSKRYEYINTFERILADSGVKILKFFLHISKDEQKKRFEQRLEDPNKMWKANPTDFEERKLWDEYIEAFEDVLSKCSTEVAPWYVIPADKKWFRNLAIAEATVDALAARRDEWNDALRVLAQAKLAELRAMRAAGKSAT